MLVLSRKIGEQIVVGRDIVVTVSDVRGDRVKLAISAPPDVSIHRREVFDRMLEADRGDDSLNETREARLCVGCA